MAAVEARCVPASDWCARIETAHAAFPEAPAIGGSVAVAEGASARDLGLYFCEYGLYVPPAQEGITRDLSGANLSYKRAALLESVICWMSENGKPFCMNVGRRRDDGLVCRTRPWCFITRCRWRPRCGSDSGWGGDMQPSELPGDHRFFRSSSFCGCGLQEKPRGFFASS